LILLIRLHLWQNPTPQLISIPPLEHVLQEN
jgi:hypothetical protein